MEKYNKTAQAKDRRRNVVDRLTSQLKSGKKFEKVEGKTTLNKVELTDKDKTRIKNEINVLENRI